MKKLKLSSETTLSMPGSTEETVISFTRDWVIQMSAVSGVWPLRAGVSQRNQELKKAEVVPKLKSLERTLRCGRKSKTWMSETPVYKFQPWPL